MSNTEIKIHPGATDPDSDQVNLLGGKSFFHSDLYYGFLFHFFSASETLYVCSVYISLSSLVNAFLFN